MLNSTYTYDANGNMLTGNGHLYTWTAANYPTSISRGNSSETILYNPLRERVKRTSIDNGLTTTVSINPRLDSGGSYEEIQQSNGTLDRTVYLYAQGETIGARVMHDGKGISYETRYYHTDHLGSVMAVTNETGAVLNRFAYDPWGKRRALDGKDDVSSSLLHDLSGLRLPSASNDPYQLIQRQAGGLVLHSNNKFASSPMPLGSLAANGDTVHLQANLRTSASYPSRRSSIVGISNNTPP